MSALRWISDANAETILLKGLRSDTDPSVRLASAIALGARDMTRLAFNAQKLALATDASPEVRTAVVANIARARAGFPEAKALLQKATTDSAKSVRDAASSALKVRQ
jgi:HEAT repeat protein